MPEISLVISTVARHVVPKAAGKAQRTEAVQCALKALKVPWRRPPRDFDGLYTFALVSYGVDKPPAILDFFRDEYLREAFRHALETGDSGNLEREADRIAERWADEGVFTRFDYDPRRELGAFTAVFTESLDTLRDAVEIDANRKLDQIAAGSGVLIQRLEEIPDTGQLIALVHAAMREVLASAPRPSQHRAALKVGLISSETSRLSSIASELQREVSMRGVGVDIGLDSIGAPSAQSEGDGLDLVIVVLTAGPDTPILEQYRSLHDMGTPSYTYLFTDGLPIDRRLQAVLKAEKSNNFVAVQSAQTFEDLIRRISDDVTGWLRAEYRRVTARIASKRYTGLELGRLEARARHLLSASQGSLEQGAALDLLNDDVGAWFRALNYEAEDYQSIGERYRESIIQVPSRRRGYERIVVRVVASEVVAQDVDAAIDSMRAAQTDEAWIVGHTRVAPAARTHADGHTNVYCFTFDELLEDGADFSSYLDWLDAEVQTRRIDERFVPLAGLKTERIKGNAVTSTYGEDTGWLEGYLDRWLSDPSKEHISILGEFGTGKSWLTLHYAWGLARRYREARERGMERPRLPLVIPLRDYAKAVSAQSLFSEFFFRKHNVRLPNYAAFEQLNRFGKLLLIFDGFDEMASRVDRQARINNFWQLAQVVVPGAKAILTCRSEHFPTGAEERRLLNAELRASTSALTGEPPQFEQMHVATMNEAQVRRMLLHRTDEATVDRIVSNPALLDLVRRPVMADLILDALPEVEAGADVSLTRVYMYAIRRKMDRDISQERTFTSLADKLFFLCELSWQMYTSDAMSINYRSVPETLQRCFSARIANERDLDHWHYDMLGQTILVRTSEGDYSPAHRSFIEFFVAYKLCALFGILPSEFCELSRQPDSSPDTPAADYEWDENFIFAERDAVPKLQRFSQVSPSRLVETVRQATIEGLVVRMMAEMATVEVERAVDILRAGLRRIPKDVEGYQDVVRALASVLMEIDGDALVGADLEGVDWRGARLDFGMMRRPLNLRKANLRGAVLAECDLENVVLADADLTGADFTGCTYFPREGNYLHQIAVNGADQVIGRTVSDALVVLSRGEKPIRRSLKGTSMVAFPSWQRGDVLVARKIFDESASVTAVDRHTLRDVAEVTVPGAVSSALVLKDVDILVAIVNGRLKWFDLQDSKPLGGLPEEYGDGCWLHPSESEESGFDFMVVKVDERWQDGAGREPMSGVDTILEPLSIASFRVSRRTRLVKAVSEWQARLSLDSGLEEAVRRQSWHSQMFNEDGRTYTILRDSDTTIHHLIACDSHGSVMWSHDWDGGADVTSWLMSDAADRLYLALGRMEGAETTSVLCALGRSDDVLVERWRFETGAAQIAAMAISSDDEYVVVADDSCRATVLDAVSGEVLFEGTSSQNYMGAIMQDAVGIDEKVAADLASRGARVQLR